MKLEYYKRVHLMARDQFAALALLLGIILILVKSSEANDNNQTKAETNSNPSHLSWTSNNTRYDFVFSINNTIRSLVKLESDPANFLTPSLEHCTNKSACLFRNGTYIESFQLNQTNSHKSIFVPDHASAGRTAALVGNSSAQCDNGNKFEISHYCSTNWNPPIYLVRVNCKHILEWHSPITCHANAISHEHPCYIYEPSGKLIDLTHWVLSNGSSYPVDVDNSSSSNSSKIKQFNLNVCNEAHDKCGPNVSACYIDSQLGTIESGYNNLTSIKYDAKEQAVLVTSLGHHKPQCEGSRLRTVIRFICKNKIIPQTGPRLVRSTGCESIIEWPTVHACPVSEVRAPATDCRIRNEPLGIDIDLRKLTNNQSMVEVPGIKIDGQDKKMLLGICKAIPKSISCEGKSNSNTKACLVNARDNSSTVMNTANNSQIVGSVAKSIIRLADDRIYLESFAINKTCSEPVHSSFDVTRKIGTRIEFYCSTSRQDRPTFIGFDDCTYTFEWGSPELCLEAFSTKNRTKKVIPEDAIVPIKKFKIKDVMKDVSNKVVISKKPVEPKKLDLGVADASPPKMNSAHKFFMISLIVMSFAAFIVIIFVLDKKTRLRITLRQARQAFQSNNQQPYSRVVSDLDL